MSTFKTSPDKCRLLHQSKPNTVFCVWQRIDKKCLHFMVFLMGFLWDPLGLLAFQWEPLKSKSPALPVRMYFISCLCLTAPLPSQRIVSILLDALLCALSVVCSCPLTFNSQQPHFHNTCEMQLTKMWVCWFKAPIYWCHMISLSPSFPDFPLSPSSPLWYQISFDL